MNFFTVFILLNFVLFNLSCVQANSPTASETAEKSEPPELSVWKIQASPIRNGTGFFIGEDLFVTNFHVIANGLNVKTKIDMITHLLEKNNLPNFKEILAGEILTEEIFNKANKDNQDPGKNIPDIENIILSQKEHPSVIKVKKILALSALYDLALLETEEKVTHYLSLREKPAESSEPLFIPGYPAGSFKKIQKTGNIFYEDKKQYAFPVNHFNLKGASGSPVLDEQGQIIGIGFEAIRNILYAIKITHLEDFITGNTGSNCSDFFNLKTCIIREMEKLKDLAHRGNSAAQYKWAHELNGFYRNENTEQFLKPVFKWYKEAAEQGYVPAQYHLAAMYSQGEGTEQSFVLAFKWYKEAAEQGYVPAQYQLANKYSQGEGIEQNFNLAFKWYKEAAEQGYVPSQYQLAEMYSQGKGTEQSFDLAFKWYKEAAEQRYAKAQYQLAEMYSQGKGTEQSFDLAFKWYWEAAKQGHAKAQRKHLEMYYTCKRTKRACPDSLSGDV